MLSDDPNWVIKFLSYISAFRYSCELLMRNVLSKMPEPYEWIDPRASIEYVILDYLMDYTWGYTTCFVVLSCMTVIYFFLAWGVLLWKSRYI